MKPHYWLADAITRHVVIRAQARHCKSYAADPFYGVTEGTAVSILETIFSGLGYRTRREVPYTGTQKKIDLFADHPADKGQDFRIEAKMIWDGTSNWLNRKRFETQREILDDFDDLRSVDAALGHRLAVWFAFSQSESLITTPPESKTLRLRDVIAYVEKFATLTGESFADLDQHAACVDGWRYFRALCWTV